MWCFKEQEGRYIYIFPGQKISFGKTSDVKLENDATVSRLHAVIFLERDEENEEISYKCTMSDLSKYGTFVLRDGEKRRLKTNEKFILKVGDIIQFGLKRSIFSVTCYTFSTVTSSLNQEEMTRLRNIIGVIGGTMCEDWQNSCTHLTVSTTVLFTSKLACALASAKIIITMSYWEALKKAIKENKELPKIDDFLPEVKEEWLHAHPQLFLPMNERKTLFNGLSFVHFCTKQYFAYTALITGAGGKSCVYPTKKPLTPRHLTAKNAIVIQQPANDSSQYTQVVATDYPIIYHKLSALKRRMIHDSEIPLAILHCSIEKYCNPKFDFGTMFKSATQIFSLSDDLIAKDTQDTSSISDNRENKRPEKQHRVIPETCDSQISLKRARPNESEARDMQDTALISDKEDIKRMIKEHRVIPESCDLQNTPKKARLIYENNGRDVSEINRQSRVIPETCNSLDESITNDISIQEKTKKFPIIPSSCEESDDDSVIEKVKNILQENTKPQQREENVKKADENLTVRKDNTQLGKNNTTSNNNNKTLGKNDSVPKENLIFEKNHSLEENNKVDQNDGDTSEGWKNPKRPRIVSIERINNSSNSSVYMDRTKRKTSEKDCIIIEKIPNSPLKQQSNQLLNFEDNLNRDDQVEENDKKRKERCRKLATKWYEKYLGDGFTNEILRKDIPLGKKFAKVSISVPATRLKVDDFIV